MWLCRKTSFRITCAPDVTRQEGTQEIPFPVYEAPGNEERVTPIEKEKQKQENYTNYYKNVRIRYRLPFGMLSFINSSLARELFTPKCLSVLHFWTRTDSVYLSFDMGQVGAFEICI